MKEERREKVRRAEQTVRAGWSRGEERGESRAVQSRVEERGGERSTQ